MVPITYGPTGLVMCLTAEFGVIVISVDAQAGSRMKEVLDNNGNIVGVGHYAFKRDYKVSATWLNTGTGLSVASVGNTVTLANQLNTNGVSGGHTVVSQVSHRLSQEDFVKFDLSGTQYPAI
jgi:hypothetical protein